MCVVGAARFRSKFGDALTLSTADDNPISLMRLMEEEGVSVRADGGNIKNDITGTSATVFKGEINEDDLLE
ncbi:MAG: hypothetical protein KAG53_10955 [Endozoicomonadaceae bacterium]|nr:hypothetical protein [Endozoicomonadaceae bacterium]